MRETIRRLATTLDPALLMHDLGLVPDPWQADALRAAVRPMLSVSRGRLVALSTPRGKRGWFFDAWHDPATAWHRVQVLATECPRIAPEFLAEERRALGERWFRQEYLCGFEE